MAIIWNKNKYDHVEKKRKGNASVQAETKKKLLYYIGKLSKLVRKMKITWYNNNYEYSQKM